MQGIRTGLQKRNLFLTFDAFGTLYKPRRPVAEAYGRAALRHGIVCVQDLSREIKAEDFNLVKASFSQAYKEESGRHPNYGKLAGIGVQHWWANVYCV